METPGNTFKEALASGPPRIGLWLALADAYCAEVCATTGFDWLVIDAEHAPYDLRSILAALQAVAGHGVDAVVRLPQGDPTLIKQLLEIGATTLLVPMVDSADEARAIVRATRYPPDGVRGVGSGLGRSSRWSSYGDYLKAAADQVCVLVQVESVAALSAVREIAEVDGVDGVFVGAADLAASMGHLGQPAHPEVRRAVEDAIATIRAAGKPAGVLETDNELARRSLALGAGFVAVGTDVGVLTRSLRQLAEMFKDGNAAVLGVGY
jgi:4-hydroxy-2-oxoheptanedioate aldolase